MARTGGWGQAVTFAGALLVAHRTHASEGGNGACPSPSAASPAPETAAGTAAPGAPAAGTAPQMSEEPPAPCVPTVNIVRANLEPSYLTFPVIFSGVDPLILETNVAPHFFLTPTYLPLALALTPKIVLRMFQGNSVPVKTPSYMPRLTLFAWLDQTFTGRPIFYSSLMLSHHSNGQSGPFQNPDGTNNHETGSFATNFLELSVYRAGWRPALLGWTGLSIEWHPGLAQELGPAGHYGRLRLHAATTMLVKVLLDAKLTLKISSILDQFRRSSGNDVVRELERFPVSAQYIMKVPGIDVGVYLGYYFGHDYYNIWFDRLANVLQVGLGADVGTNLPGEL